MRAQGDLWREMSIRRTQTKLHQLNTLRASSSTPPGPIIAQLLTLALAHFATPPTTTSHFFENHLMQSRWCDSSILGHLLSISKFNPNVCLAASSWGPLSIQLSFSSIFSYETHSMKLVAYSMLSTSNTFSNEWVEKPPTKAISALFAEEFLWSFRWSMFCMRPDVGDNGGSWRAAAV